MLVSEVIFFNMLNSFMTLLQEDCAKTNEKQRYLYKLYKTTATHDISVQGTDFYRNSLNLFKRDVEVQRKIMVCMGYNGERASSPTMHILLPQDKVKHHTIGEGIGFEPDLQEGTETTELLNNVYSANYNILLSSDSMTEVLCMYHTLKAMMLAFFEQFEFAGMMNLSIGGADVTLQSGMIAPNIFHRNLGITFDYEFTVPRFTTTETKLIKDIVIKGKMIN